MKFQLTYISGKRYTGPNDSAMTNETKKLLEKKAYEIIYALFRMSGNLNGRPFAAYIENHSLSLFDSAVYGNKDEANREAAIIEYYLRLGGDVGLLNQLNVAATINEIGKLIQLIAELPIAGLPEYIKLPFAGSEPKAIADIQRSKEIPSEVINKEIEAMSNLEDSIEESGIEFNEPVKNQSVNYGIRQSTIINRIKEVGNCRMRDLLEVLPNVSERTLRYDLEKLMDAGIIERIGQSGPATIYKVVGDIPAIPVAVSL